MSVLVTQSSLKETLPESQAITICLDDDGDALARQRQENVVSGTQADNLLYVMYTSGSTGTPKGIGITHRNVARLVQNTNYGDLID